MQVAEQWGRGQGTQAGTQCGGTVTGWVIRQAGRQGKGAGVGRWGWGPAGGGCGWGQGGWELTVVGGRVGVGMEGWGGVGRAGIGNGKGTVLPFLSSPQAMSSSAALE